MEPIQIESFLQFRYVSNPTYSPDGRWVAFVVQQADRKENGYWGDLWLLDTATGASRALTCGGDAKSYCWTERGTLLFPSERREGDKYAARRAVEPLTVFYEIDPEGGEAREAFVLPLDHASLTRVDGTRYAAVARYDRHFPAGEGLDPEERRRAVEEYRARGYETFEELPFWFNGQGYVSGTRRRLYLYDAETGALEALTPPDFDVDSLCVSADRLLIKGAAYTLRRTWNFGVYLCDLADKTLRCLLEPDAMKTGPVAFWNGTILLAATDGKAHGTEEYCDFYTVDAGTGKLTKLADYDRSIGVGSVGSDARLGGGRTEKAEGDTYYFVTTEGDSAILRALGPDGVIRDMVTRPGSCDSFDVRDGRLVLCGMYDGKLAELYDGAGRQLTDLNGDYIRSHSVVKPEHMSYTGSDGVEIHGWAMKPVGYQPGKRYPAVLHIHGGPRTVFGEVYHHEMQLWANAGYFVFYCNPRGSDGRGSDFGDIAGGYGTVEYVNLMEFLDEMLRRYPDADPDRLGVAGGSYGGFMTNWIIGHTDRFRAAVSQRSISNWISFEHTCDCGTEFMVCQMGTNTEKDEAALWEQSPLRYAPRAVTPTLFIHADCDYRCWMGEGVSMFTALRMKGVESKLCLFHGESHELSRSGKPENRISRMREILSWLDAHLKV